SRVVGGRVAAVRSRPPPQRWTVATRHRHTCAQHVPAIDTRQFQAEPMVLVADIVDEETGGTIRGADKHINIPVVVDVAERGAPADIEELERLAAAIRDVLALALSRVSTQQGEHP